MSMHESAVEDEIVGTFTSAGYGSMTGAALLDSVRPERASLADALLSRRLSTAIRKLNPQLPSESIDEVVRIVGRPPHATLIENNRWFHELLTDGVPIEYRDAAIRETRGGHARLIDFDHPSANDWLVVRQVIVKAGEKSIRADLVVYVNGLPLVIVELKDPTDDAADLWQAIDQLGRYRETVPELFTYIALLVASDGLLTRVGSITSGRNRFTPWRTDEGGEPTLDALVRGALAPDRFTDYLRSCVVFEEDERGQVNKKVAGYHQFRAVRKARRAVVEQATSATSDGRGGVIWHTQGSGKSLTMLMLAGALVREEAMQNPTIVVVTDRNDLDDQLFGTFAAGRALLRQPPTQAESRTDLAGLLDRAAGGVVFTTIQKFAEEHGKISDRTNVIVLADEAHRSQYGFDEGVARWMRQSLPGATFVGFTGTPVDSDDRSTPRVFGDYVDVYDIKQAVRDGATVPIYYESRVVKLTVDQAGADAAARVIDAAAEANAHGNEPAADVRIAGEHLVGAPERIERLAAFIVDHFEQRRSAIEGKAMAVTMSRDIAARLYEAIAKLRPEWHDADDQRGMMKVIVTGSQDDKEPLRSHVRSTAQRKRLAERFKDPTDDFRLAIVCDMWLTGFDCPPMHTMYLDKPLAGHSLMQAIARVNRVWGEKPGGLVVDLLGLADQLADALATYTRASGDKSAVRNVQDEAVPAMLRAFEQIQDFFHGFDYSAGTNGRNGSSLRIYAVAADFVLQQKDGWKRYRDMTKKLSSAFALAVPRPESEAIAPHLAFFQRLSTAIRKRLFDERGAPATSNDVDAAVRQVIGSAVDAGAVIDLFAAAGLPEARLDILSDEFLQRVMAIEHKNLALETLRKLLNDQIRSSERTNIVQSRKFREALEDAMARYTNKSITTAEVVTRLIEIAKVIREARQRGEELGLSGEEAAFYDALAENESAREVLKDDRLRLLARELADAIKQRKFLDWTQREAVKADLRRSVRRLLAKYGYPPDLAEDATRLVMRQAETTVGASMER